MPVEAGHPLVSHQLGPRDVQVLGTGVTTIYISRYLVTHLQQRAVSAQGGQQPVRGDVGGHQLPQPHLGLQTGLQPRQARPRQPEVAQVEPLHRLLPAGGQYTSVHFRML